MVEPRHCTGCPLTSLILPWWHSPTRSRKLFSHPDAAAAVSHQQTLARGVTRGGLMVSWRFYCNHQELSFFLCHSLTCWFRYCNSCYILPLPPARPCPALHRLPALLISVGSSNDWTTGVLEVRGKGGGGSRLSKLAARVTFKSFRKRKSLCVEQSFVFMDV